MKKENRKMAQERRARERARKARRARVKKYSQNRCPHTGHCDFGRCHHMGCAPVRK